MTFNVGNQVVLSYLGIVEFGNGSYQLGNNIGVVSSISSRRPVVIEVIWTDNAGKERLNFYYEEHLERYVPLELEEML